MSATQTPPAVVHRIDDTDSFENALLRDASSAIEQLIARVLRRAHRTAERYDAPTDARTILQVAHSFADELAVADPDFDRPRFIHTVTGAAS
jgi:hypothetical protein